MKLTYLALAGALAGAALPAVTANAAAVVVNVAAAQAMGVRGAAGNTTGSYLLGANAHIIGGSYSVQIASFTPSKLSEARLGLWDSAGAGISVGPGFADNFSGVRNYTSGFTDFVALGIDFNLGADGILSTEFFETVDNLQSTADSVWNAGTVTLTYELPAAPGVPEPATWAMMIVGFGAIGAAMRRREKLTVRYAI